MKSKNMNGVADLTAQGTEFAQKIIEFQPFNQYPTNPFTDEGAFRLLEKTSATSREAREARLSRVWQVLGFPERDIPIIGGGRVTPLHPGFLNHGRGPDFKKAVLQFNGETPVTVDVEIDWTDKEWRLHGHDSNPEFDHVGLRVLWNKSSAESERLSGPPCIALQPLLEGPIWNWALGLEPETLPKHPKAIRFAGKCRPIWNSLSPEDVQSALERIALVRLWNKGEGIRIRSQVLGWGQAFYESLIPVLGYQKNYWPFRRLAELGPIWILPNADPMAIQSRLMGLSGLLPAGSPRKDRERSEYLNELWSFWWREQSQFQNMVLPKSMWRRDQIRPMNFPERRLALAAVWAYRANLPDRVRRWFYQRPKGSNKFNSREESIWRERLYGILGGNRNHPFWSYRANWNQRLSKPAALMGRGLFSEVVLNALLPWLWALAYSEENSEQLNVLEKLYLNWYSTPENSRVRALEWRLLGSQEKFLTKSSGVRQGLLGVSRFYCEKFNALCEGCPMPDRLKKEVNDCASK